MSKLPTEDFLTLYVDPGETTGWAIGQGMELLAHGMTPMWEFADDVWVWGWEQGIEGTVFANSANWREGVAISSAAILGRIVCEDWRLYPDKMQGLAWDECRTARVIGALTQTSRVCSIPMILQPAAIKDRAVKGMAQELFVVPLYENRHQNDAMMHFTYFTQTELLGMHYSGLDNLPGKSNAPS